MKHSRIIDYYTQLYNISYHILSAYLEFSYIRIRIRYSHDFVCSAVFRMQIARVELVSSFDFGLTDQIFRPHRISVSLSTSPRFTLCLALRPRSPFLSTMLSLSAQVSRLPLYFQLFKQFINKLWRLAAIALSIPNWQCEEEHLLADVMRRNPITLSGCSITATRSLSY